MIVVKPLCYSQKEGTVCLELPSDWDGPSRVVVEIDVDNTQTLLGTILSAIREEGDHEKIEAARMLCRAMLGAGP